MDKCTGFTYCGLKDKHPEYISETNQVKASIKKTREKIEALENQLSSLKNFETQSEHQFIKNMKPRLFSLNSSYAHNKPLLMRDLRLLRAHCKGKIPPVTSNDSEQLRILLEKCKKECKNKTGEEYNIIMNEQPFATANNQGSTAVNVFNISPPKSNTNDKSFSKHNKNEQNCMDNDHTSGSSEDSDENADKYPKINKKRKRRKRYRPLESSFNYTMPFNPYNYLANPMNMPMHFGTYMNPQPVPQFHQFPPVLVFHGNAENAQFPNMQPVGQNYNSDVNPILGRHYTIPGTAPSFSHEQVPPILVPAQQTQTEHVQRPLDALLQAAEMHAAVDNR